MQTSTNLKRSNFNNLTNLLGYVFNQNLFDLNSIMVCVFQKYVTVNSVKYGQVVQLINNVDTNKKPLASPIQYNVPIQYIMGGNAGINIEYQENDLVLVAYSQRTLVDLKLAWEKGQSPNKIQPSNFNTFSLEDGIILGKISPTVPTVVINITNSGISLNANNHPIEINSGTADTTVNCKNAQVNSSAKIELTASNEVDITAPSIKLNGAVTCSSTLTASTSVQAGGTTISSAGIASTGSDLNINGAPFKGHTHSGVQTGTNNTGGVV